MAPPASSAAPAAPFNSTTVRSHALVAPWSIRLALSVASVLAPALAARLGERLFLTPPRHRRPPAERYALARGEEFVVQASGERLRAWRFGTGPTVLLVHGWGGRGGQLAAFLEPLEDAGCSVVTFDAPAHGSSTGRLAAAPVFASAVAAVARRVGARAVVAHSIGAAGLGAAMASGLDLDAAVLIGPPRSPGAFFRNFSDALQLRRRTSDAIRARIERRYGVALEDYDLPRLVTAVNTPVLVVHDRNDQEVPWSDGEAIAGAWPGARLVSTNGLGHRRILRDAGVVRQAVQFVATRLERCGRLETRVRPVAAEAPQWVIDAWTQP